MKRQRLVRPSLARGAFLILASGALSTGAAPAAAHPHVWVTVETEVLYDDTGAMTGLRHRWSFDEGYAALATQGLDADGNGKLERAELQSLAQENAEALADYDYFTDARIEGEAVKLAGPVDYFAEMSADGVLSLRFTLPLAAPVNTGSLQFTFSVADPTFFIAFSFAEKDPVRLASNAPKGCSAGLATAPVSAEEQALGDAFAADGSSVSLATVQSGQVIVRCAS